MVVVTIALGASVFIALRTKRIEERKRTLTTALLSSVFDEIASPLTKPHLRSDLGRRTGFLAWGGQSMKFSSFQLSDRPNFLGIRDGWGHGIRYACPGPVHKKGWDLISAGPNGVFENGCGDDIVVGGDGNE